MKSGVIALNPVTVAQLQSYVKRPAQALALVSAINETSWKMTDNLIESVLKDNINRLINTGQLLILEPPEGKTEISIDLIRQTIAKLAIKAKADSKRVVLIRDAAKLSLPAQNALLKTLEEPTQTSLLILLVDSLAKLLPTLVSRLSLIELKPLSRAQAQADYGKTYPAADIESAWLLSEGEPTLLSLLLQEPQHELRMAVTAAKDFLGQSRLERLLLLDGLSKDAAKFGLFLQALSRIIKAAHHAAITKNTRQSSRLLKARSLILQSAAMLETNTSPKLIALRLASSLNI